MRFKLVPYSPSSKGYCPRCNRKRCFTYYYDTETNERLPPDYGYCDHRKSCGYEKHPEKEFIIQWTAGERTYEKTFIPPPMPALPPEAQMRVPDEVVRATLKHYARNSFYRDYQRIFPEAVHVLSAYKLGTHSAGHPIFWAINHLGEAQTGQVVFYRADGSLKRLKTREPFFLPQYKRAEYGICFFGEHLLGMLPETIPVAVVESPKSALVCSARYKQFVWLATYGRYGVSQNNPKWRWLKETGRRIVLFPDNDDDGREAFDKIAAMYNLEQIQLAKHIPGMQPSDDIADIVIKYS